MFEHWQQAKATVVAVKDLTNWTGDPNSDWTQSTPHEYVVDVRPDSEPPFRATFRDPYLRGHRDHPTEGQVIDVLYHSKSHDVKLIAEQWKHSDDELQEQQQAEDARFEAASKAAPGESAPEAASGPGVVHFTGGDRVRRIDDTSSDDADQLAKLADLHDRGVLSEAEFEAEKAKVLGQD